MEIMGESQQNSEQKMERKQNGKESSLRLKGQSGEPKDFMAMSFDAVMCNSCTIIPF